jgi:putative endonuclease
MDKTALCCVYILTNDRNTVLYTGVTSDLRKRLWEHRHKVDKTGFCSRYNLHKLVFFEVTSDIRGAILREKQIKNWWREWKVRLIEEHNPDWKDLSTGWF